MNKRQKRFYEKFKSENINSEQINKAKNMAGHLGKLSSKFLLLLKMINSNIKGEFKISVITLTDAIPDFLPFFGFGDDIAVVTYVLAKLNKLVSEYEEFENGNGQQYNKKKEPDYDNMRTVSEDE